MKVVNRVESVPSFLPSSAPLPSSSFSLCNVSYQTGDCVYLPPDCYQFLVKPQTTPKEHSEVSEVCTYTNVGGVIVVITTLSFCDVIIIHVSL